MIKTTRQESILDEVQKKGLVSLADLAQILSVSEITIHRDLEELEKAGKLKRVRGGAKRISPFGPEPPVLQRHADQINEKRSIALEALRLIVDGEVIALESGSTTIELARAISQKRGWKDLQVVTNSFPIVQELLQVEGVKIVFLGGIVSPGEMGTFGIFTELMLKQLSINKVFLGCRGIDTKVGLSNSIQAEAEVTTVQAFVQAANQTIILADHTKFGFVFLFHMLSIQQIDVVVTDSLTDPHFISELREQDIQILIANLDSLMEDNPGLKGYKKKIIYYLQKKEE